MSTKERWAENVQRFDATTIRIDSTAAAALAQNKQVSARNKHIDLRYHFVKFALGNKTVVLDYVRSSENTADMLTKILDSHTLMHLSKKIRLRNHIYMIMTGMLAELRVHDIYPRISKCRKATICSGPI